MSSLESCIVFRQEYTSSRIGDFRGCCAHLALSRSNVGLVNKQSLFGLGQQVPVPVADRIVQTVLNIVDDNLLAFLQFIARRSIVSILVRHHIQQLHRTMRSGRDGQRDIYTLTIGIRSTGVSGNILVVDIDRTLDEPVVGRHCTTWFYSSFILSTDVVAVVNDNLGTMYEVTRSLPFY